MEERDFMHYNNKGVVLPFVIITSAILAVSILSMGAVLQYSSRFSHVYHRDVASLYIAKNYVIAGRVASDGFGLDFEVVSEELTSVNRLITVYFPDKEKAEYKRSYFMP